MRRLPPRSTLFPYTTLFGSSVKLREDPAVRGGGLAHLLDPRVGEDEARRVPELGDEAAPELRPLVGVGERSEEHTSELQSRQYLACRLLLVIKTLTNSGSQS